MNWNATKAIMAVPGQYQRTVPAAAQEVMFTVAYSFRGGGESDVRVDFADRVNAISTHRAAYLWDLVDARPSGSLSTGRKGRSYARASQKMGLSWDSCCATENKNPRFPGALGADDGTRTHDLLHGKQTL